MSGPIYLITGVPGSGKTSVARALMCRYPRGIHIPVDDLREWVVSGIAHPVPEWTEETGRQFTLAREVAVFTAQHYAQAGFAVAIDEVILPAESEALFERPFDRHAFHRVVLRPPLAAALMRNEARDNKAFDTGILTATIRTLDRVFGEQPFAERGWHVIDNGDLSVDDTVDAILESVQEHPPR